MNSSCQCRSKIPQLDHPTRASFGRKIGWDSGLLSFRGACPPERIRSPLTGEFYFSTFGEFSLGSNSDCGGSGGARGRGGTASRSISTNTSRCAQPERRFSENRKARRRPTAEPAPKPRKTDADAEMSPLGAEPALFPLKTALRKTPGKPAVRKNRHLFCQTLTICIRNGNGLCRLRHRRLRLEDRRMARLNLDDDQFCPRRPQPSHMPNGSPKPESTRLSEASETATTTPWPKPPSDCSKPRSSNTSARGKRQASSNGRP